MVGTAAPRDTPLFEQTAVLFARRGEAVRTRYAWEARAEWREQRGLRQWNPLDIVFGTALFAIFLLNVLDITITLIHTGRVGWSAEGNVLIRVLAESGGAAAAVVFKMFLITLAVYVMWRLYRQTMVAMAIARRRDAHRRANFVFRSQVVATSFLMLLYVWIVQHNLRIVWF